METQLDKRFGFLVADVDRLCGNRFDVLARSSLNLTRAQCRVLAYLSHYGEVNQARLAGLLEVAPISAGRLLDRMEEGGWIERRSDAADRRVRMIFPTAKASAAYAEVKSLAGEVYEESLVGVSPEDRRVLIRALDTIVQNLADGETSSLKSTEGAAA